jgi:hypothetical protein
MSATMAIDMSNTYFVKKGEFVMRSIAGQTILVPVRNDAGDLDSIYNLNEVAAFVWKLLDDHTNVRQIVDAVSIDFDVTPEEAENDTLQFIGALEAAGIVEPSPKT